MSSSHYQSAYSDKTPIVSITFPDDSCYVIGTNVTKIIAYEENGEMAAVLWFACLNKDGKILHRVNSKFVQSIDYERSE
jgi:hypothetical protein